jgi:nitroreductase
MTTKRGEVAIDALSMARSMAEAARWAPSVHNSQPWRFVTLEGGGLGVRADLGRGPDQLDPAGRLRTISCGAAVANAAVAAAAYGVRPRVDLLPDPADEDLLATVRARGSRPPDRHDVDDAAAIPTRRAHRRVHRRGDVAPEVMLDLQRLARREGADLAVADAAGRRALAGLLARALREQASDAAVVEEVEDWVRHRGPAAPPQDGVPVASLGTAPYPVDSLVQEHTDPDRVRAAEIAEALADATVLGIGTPGDTPRDWLVAGMALERVWLRLTALGHVLTFADQATQQSSTRSQVADALDVRGVPQVVVRVGLPLVDVPVTPRRPLDDVLT